MGVGWSWVCESSDIRESLAIIINKPPMGSIMSINITATTFLFIMVDVFIISSILSGSKALLKWSCVCLCVQARHWSSRALNSSVVRLGCDFRVFGLLLEGSRLTCVFGTKQKQHIFKVK